MMPNSRSSRKLERAGQSYVGRLRFSQISYHTDVSTSHGRVIRLGVMTELVVASKVHGLALVARTSLGEDELKAVTPAVADSLSNPFDLLKEQFEWAWTKHAPGKCLSALANRHQYSLRFETPNLTRVSIRPVKTSLIAAAKLRMCEIRDQEFQDYLHDGGSGRVEEIQEHAQQICRAAA